MRFEKLGLTPALLEAVREMGFIYPTKIQELVITEILAGDRDLVGLAHTGTGKTAAFGLPMIQLTDFTAPRSQALVICPTRELCRQISSDFQKFSRYIPGTRIATVYGGADIRAQIREVRKKPHIIVATPGRLHDLIRRRAVDITGIRFLVLDEADEMLNMGFQEDLDAILSKTPEDKRIWLFSATMPKAVARIAAGYMKAYREITAGMKNSAAQNISHASYTIREKNRYPALKRIIDYYPGMYGLIFCRTRDETRQVSEKLVGDGYNAEALHGELSQSHRDQVMQKFRNKTIRLLVATDVAARGLDVEDVSHVINYNLPDDAHTYTHRSGRTARAGKSGISIALTNTGERRKLSEMARKAGVRFNAAKVPGKTAICEKQIQALVARLIAMDIDHEEVDKFLKPVYQTLDALPRDELIRRFVTLSFSQFLESYKGVEDIDASACCKPAKPVRNKGTVKDNAWTVKSAAHRHARKTQCFSLNAGKLANIREGAITRLLCDGSGINSKCIGKIEISRNVSFVEIDQQVANAVFESMQNTKLDGRRVIFKPVKHRAPAANPKKNRA